MALSSLLHQWSYRVLLNETTPFNFIAFSATIIFFFFFIYLYKNTRNNDHKFHNLPPSPPKLPIIGNLHQIGKLLHRDLHALSTKYGPLMTLHLGTSQFLVVSSAEIVDEIIKQDLIFSNKPQKKGIEILLSGSTDIPFGQYDNYLRFVKKICVNQILSPTKVQAFKFVREEEIGRVVDKIKLACRENDVVDLSEIFVTVNSSIVARSAFGRVLKYDCESAGRLVKAAIYLSIKFWVGDLFPYLGWMDVLIGNTRSLNKVSKELHNFLDRVIEDHGDSKLDVQEKDFVDILLDVQQDPTVDIRLTRENIKVLLLDMFLGGTETAASTLEWAMAELVKNPSKMKKAQEEVRKVVGKKSKLDENDIHKMKYLKLIIKETMRLHAPIIPRATSESTVLMGYNIPAKMQLIINVWAIQRDSKSWENPDEFYPERFDEVDVDFRGNRGHFFPFGFGRRICPGITHATAVMEYVLANLLYWFDWKLPCGSSLEDFDMSDSFDAIIHKRKPLVLVPVAGSP